MNTAAKLKELMGALEQEVLNHFNDSETPDVTYSKEELIEYIKNCPMLKPKKTVDQMVAEAEADTRQDAHEYIRDDARLIFEAIEAGQLADDPELMMTVVVNGPKLAAGRKVELGLWSTDVCHILACAFRDIEDFADSQL